MFIKKESDPSSDDDDVEYNNPGRQRKIGPQQWDGVACQKVGKRPEGINGLLFYKVCNVNDTKESVATLTDGRGRKKDSYANCNGSYQSMISACIS